MTSLVLGEEREYATAGGVRFRVLALPRADYQRRLDAYLASFPDAGRAPWRRLARAFVDLRCGSCGPPTIVVREDQRGNDRLVAHELGHVLGRAHTVEVRGVASALRALLNARTWTTMHPWPLRFRDPDGLLDAWRGRKG